MFEQTFIEVKTDGKKPYTVLFSLMLQVTVLGVLIIVPLIYTQVLPQARLRSVFAAPIPPPPPLQSTKAKPSERKLAFSPRRYLGPGPALPLSSPHPAGPDIVSLDTPPVISGDPNGIVGSTVEMFPLKQPDPPAVQTPKPATHRPVHVGSIDPSQLIHRVQPTYPQIARTTHVQGTVEFTAVISKVGTIENLQLVRGHPLLVNAAKEAILQWRYKPTLLNGEPVEVITNILVNFTLNQ